MIKINLMENFIIILIKTMIKKIIDDSDGNNTNDIHN